MIFCECGVAWGEGVQLGQLGGLNLLANLAPSSLFPGRLHTHTVTEHPSAARRRLRIFLEKQTATAATGAWSTPKHKKSSLETGASRRPNLVKLTTPVRVRLFILQVAADHSGDPIWPNPPAFDEAPIVAVW